MNRCKNHIRTAIIVLQGLLISICTSAQQQFELNTGWKYLSATSVKVSGEQLSQSNYPLTGWGNAVVPGTVLTSLLHNGLIPDPFYGLNNERIPDIYKAGRDYYTYWFVKDFNETMPAKGEMVWLYFRGINYSADIFLNGHKINDKPDKGMFLRQSYDITRYIAKDGHNRLAVIVYPPDPVGNPNGGQGGDGTIAHSITNQYVAGWDWIQPVRDRNTGIWDKVFIKKTKELHVEHTHVITTVPGRRMPNGKQAPAFVKITTEVENPDSTKEIEGVVQYEFAGKKGAVKVKLEPLSSELVEFGAVSVDSPMLWWPNGYGAQPLYDLTVSVLINKAVSDEEQVRFGIREIKTAWNTKTNSREIRVNGQKIFIKGGNWITSDAMLRCSKERYDAEIHYHRDMNLNLIRVWGGGITERPEFYDACDKYGLMVMQDFWVSGDCNGRWYDPLKLEDTIARRKYPDDHALFLESLEDQVKMLRNHPSLALWCGGNEIRPPADILQPFRDSILPKLDGTRFFFEFSNDDSMSLHGGDGPYTIQPDSSFWEKRSFPFNSEVGSVGIGDQESLERFIPKEHLVPPHYDVAAHKWIVDSVWRYHKYVGYDSVLEAYGKPKDIRDFCRKAQLVNYNQYRALIEGATAHMWDWYTGIIVWKTQNPWTAMVGQMYDVYLDPNACLYGLCEGSKPLHVMYDAVRQKVMIANNGFAGVQKLQMTATILDVTGTVRSSSTVSAAVGAGKTVICDKLPKIWNTVKEREGLFYMLELRDSAGNTIDENLYWLPDSRGGYNKLEQMSKAGVDVLNGRLVAPGRAEVEIANSEGVLAFFMRISLVDARTKKRILPAFCNNNYISLLPNQRKTVTVEFTPQEGVTPMIEVEGWNVDKIYTELKK